MEVCDSVVVFISTGKVTLVTVLCFLRFQKHLNICTHDLNVVKLTLVRIV